MYLGLVTTIIRQYLVEVFACFYCHNIYYTEVDILSTDNPDSSPNNKSHEAAIV